MFLGLLQMYEYAYITGMFFYLFLTKVELHNILQYFFQNIVWTSQTCAFGSNLPHLKKFL